MSETRKRNAIHSGIGDKQDLLVKKPKEEDIQEDFQYAARLRGKKRHNTMIYPEIPFEYGVSYTGQTLETYNEKEYKYDINAHPRKDIEYCIEQTKELPIKRLWEARACFEAEVKRWNLEYGLKWKGHTGIIDKRTAEYAVHWKGQYTVENLGDVKELFTSSKGDYIGYDEGSEGWRLRGSHVEDVRNRSFFSGVVAKEMYNWNAYEAAFSFRPILNNGEGAFNNTMRYNWSRRSFYRAGKWDDDLVGLIFQAQDKNNFYMMMWEADERIWLSGRSGSNLDGLNINSGGGEFVNRQDISSVSSSGRPSHSQWVDYNNNAGWGRMHRRIYKVTNGVMRRVNVSDRGSGKGWVMGNMHRLRVETTGRNVKIFARTSPTGSEEKVFDFNTDWNGGAFGMLNISQSVEFHNIDVIEKRILEGRIPETGWDRSKDPYKTISSNATSYVKSSDSFKNELPRGITSSRVAMLEITGSVRNTENGSIHIFGRSGRIVVKAFDYSTWKDYSGRTPTSGWFEFDGIGDKIHATNTQDFIRQQRGISDLIIDKVEGIVKDPEAGTVIVTPRGPFIARNNNAPDAGEIYNQCYIRCGIVEVTPDHRDYNTGLVVWEDIATVFEEDYKEFFNRDDYINKKQTYELLKPVKKEPPKPPPIDESEAGCVIEEEPPEEPDPIIECLNDFDFDGKKLVMWSCEFPIDQETQCFMSSVYAYEGWKTFNPLENFEPNDWTTYELKPVEGTIYVGYDEIKWAGRTDYDNAPVGTKVIIRTIEWYKAIFPSDIVNEGIITTEGNIVSEIPPAPEHFWHPEAEDITDVENRMPDHFAEVHYLLDAWDNHPDVVIWFESNPNLTTDNVDRQTGSLAHEGRVGMPIVLTKNDTDRVVIHCKEDPRYLTWSSGKYIGYGKVNGKRPYWKDGAGRADMVNISTEVVFFPENLVMGSLEGPFIDIYDYELGRNGRAKPDHEINREEENTGDPIEMVIESDEELPRIKARLHQNGKMVDFYSDHTDAYVWYTDWYSNWVESKETHQATMRDIKEIEAPLNLDPADPAVSDDYNPDDTTIERIEVSSDNPFVKLWIEEDKGPYNGLLGTYYRFPLTANIYEEEFQVKGDYQEWMQNYDIYAYMTNVSFPLEHDDATIIEVQVNNSVIPNDSINGWILEDGHFSLFGNAIQEGLLEIYYSTGSIINSFELEKPVGEYVEVFVNGELLEEFEYQITDDRLIINQNLVYLHDWIHIQSYELNDLYDPTRRHYLGERKYSQLDFQEDIPTSIENPNYVDPYYEGSFAFNWGFKRPIGMEEQAQAAFFAKALEDTRKANFRYNIDLELIYLYGDIMDISNFTGEWEQWHQNPNKLNYNESTGKWTDGMGDWHGPPESGYERVTNIINQTPYSGWYHPDHVDITDYEVAVTVQSETLWDNDMYGMTFRWDPTIMSGYTFEWDAGGAGVDGMALYKLTCRNPEKIGTSETLSFDKVQLAHDPQWWDPNPPSSTDKDREFYEHRIKIAAIGRNFQVWIDGELKLEASDDTYEKGAWGPITRSNPNTYFWDFQMQTFRRVTYLQRSQFRQPQDIEKDRPMTTPDQFQFEIDVDLTQVQDHFNSIIDDYCEEVGITESEIRGVEYYITEDTSDHSVYFKQDKSIETEDGTYTIAAVVDGYYPDPDDPEGVEIPQPEEPMIPILHPPTELNPNDGFTISWNGYIYAPQTGVYRFEATVNDGFRLWIKGEEVISEWHISKDPNYFPVYEGSIYLEGGKWHSIRANFFDNIGQALIRLRWAEPKKGFQRISPDYLTPYLGYKLFAQVKQTTPLPWHPMIHNGYYYHEDKEHYLYADKIVHHKTPNQFHEVEISPRPQQGSAIIVRDNEGNPLRKVTFYDEDWNLTLENKEVFHGNGYAKYYLNYKGIDKNTIKVKLNGEDLYNNEYLFHEEDSAIEFMEKLGPSDAIEVRYILLYSYCLDINSDIVDGFVNRDVSRIVLHHNYDPKKMENMEIIYEAAKETPFYRAEEVVHNPILNHNHTGFVYITETDEQEVKDLLLHLSNKRISNTGAEQVLITARVTDKYNNPCPNKSVKIYRDDILISSNQTTNEAGEIYIHDQPVPSNQMVSTYRAECDNHIAESLLDYHKNYESKRYYLDIDCRKMAILAGVEDTSTILVTLRDHHWNPVGAGKSIIVEHRNSHGDIEKTTHTTNEYGQVNIMISGINEKHGNMMIKVLYNMGFEYAANYIHMKVIGG